MQNVSVDMDKASAVMHKVSADIDKVSSMWNFKWCTTCHKLNTATCKILDVSLAKKNVIYQNKNKKESVSLKKSVLH